MRITFRGREVTFYGVGTSMFVMDPTTTREEAMKTPGFCFVHLVYWRIRLAMGVWARIRLAWSVLWQRRGFVLVSDEPLLFECHEEDEQGPIVEPPRLGAPRYSRDEVV